MATFDGEVGQTFRETSRRVRYEVRKRLVQKSLEGYIADLPVGSKALDIGGGEGFDTEWLSSRGLAVTLVEPSSEMLIAATSRLKEKGHKVRTIQGDDAYAQKLLVGERFDLVLSHAVLMYHPSPQEHVDRLASFTKPGGIVSLLTKGLAGAIEQKTREGDRQAVDSLIQTGRYQNNLGEQAVAFSAQTIIGMIEATDGLEMEDWFGVRTNSNDDRRLVGELPREELESLIESEWVLGQDPATRAGSQMLHFVARHV